MLIAFIYKTNITNGQVGSLSPKRINAFNRGEDEYIHTISVKCSDRGKNNDHKICWVTNNHILL